MSNWYILRLYKNKYLEDTSNIISGDELEYTREYILNPLQWQFSKHTVIHQSMSHPTQWVKLTFCVQFLSISLDSFFVG